MDVGGTYLEGSLDIGMSALTDQREVWTCLGPFSAV